MIARSTNIHQALRSRQRGMLLNPFWHPTVAPNDPYWANVVSLMHMDSGWSDETGKVWTPNSSPTIDTTFYKFGGGSGRFPGGPYVETPASSDWAFGTGDFTVEAFLYATVMPTGLFHSPFGNWISNTGWTMFLQPSGVIGWTGGSLGTASPTNTIQLAQWQHVAYSRNGTTGRLFVGGAQVSSWTDSVNYTSTNGIRLGGNRTSTDWWRGNIDEFRVTKGIGRYTTNFVPPNAPFANHT